MANRGWITEALKDWIVSGSLTAETGLPLTARVLGNLSDTAGTGNVGSGRAEATGLPVGSGSGVLQSGSVHDSCRGDYAMATRAAIRYRARGRFFAELAVAAAHGADLGAPEAEPCASDSTNFTNHVNIAGYGTVVNSLTYGVPTSAGAMRNLTITARFNF